jgi:hypothetical protein
MQLHEVDVEIGAIMDAKQMHMQLANQGSMSGSSAMPLPWWEVAGVHSIRDWSAPVLIA